MTGARQYECAIYRSELLGRGNHVGCFLGWRDLSTFGHMPELIWLSCPYCACDGFMTGKALIIHVNKIHKDKLPDYQFDYI